MYAIFFKRAIDFILSLCALIVLSPLLLVLSVLGTFFMRGNPFFFQERPGKKEKIFRLVKFRSMDNRRNKNCRFRYQNVRLNRYGKFLRSTSLDALLAIHWILLKEICLLLVRGSLLPAHM